MEAHPAIRFVQVGRGLGRTRIPVVAFGNVGRSSTLHVVHENRALCGQRGELTEKYDEVDPKAVRVAGANVCYRCSIALGPIPMPYLVSGQED